MATVTGKIIVKMKCNVKWWFKFLPLVLLEKIIKVDLEMVEEKGKS